MAKLDFQHVSRVALAHSRTLVTDISPGGELIGKEYTCAGISGGKGTSCKINIDTGKWSDFATGEKGGDFIALWAAVYGVSQLDAAKALASHLHIAPEKHDALPAPRREAPVTQSEETFELPYRLGPVPESAKASDFYHFQFGFPTAKWLYRGAGGERLFWTVRYDSKDGKQFVPYSWCEERGKIIARAWPIRALYGLELLAQYPDTAVLIVEGEKAADAARKFIPEKTYTVVTWSGGSKAFSKTDWSPLFGRKVLIWPDNDRKNVKTANERDRYGVEIGEKIPLKHQPGMSAALGIAEILSPHCEVKYFSLHEVPLIGEIDGFDAADAYEMAWNWKMFSELVRPLARTYESKPPILELPIEDVNNEWVQGSIANLYYEARLLMNSKGEPHLNMTNVERMLASHPNTRGKIWFDDFHMKIMTTWQTPVPVEWSDIDDLMLCRVFQGDMGMHKINDKIVRDGVRIYANNNRRNEPRDWISTLKWDGVARCREFFIEAFSAGLNEYTRRASVNFLVAMVARVFEPGIKFDHMVILEGGQGKKKSSALQAIAGSWFSESTDNITSKDFAMCLQGKMIIEIAELSSFGAAEKEAIKKVITIQNDRFRPPYGHAMVTYRRTSVFVGTTNEECYLQDETGARRFWPIKITEVNLDYIKENREQLYAEALHLFREGHKFWEMPEEETLTEQEKRRSYDEYEPIVRNWLNTNHYENTYLTLDTVALNCIGLTVDAFDRRMQLRLAKVMKALKWIRTYKRIGDDCRWVWVKPGSHGSLH